MLQAVVQIVQDRLVFIHYQSLDIVNLIDHTESVTLL